MIDNHKVNDRLLKSYEYHNLDPMSKVVYKYGKLCASHPWEVIVLFLTLSIIIMSITPHPSHNQVDEDVRTNCNGNPSESLSNHHFHQEITLENEMTALSIIITFIQFLAFLYIYQQIRSILIHSSIYLVGIAFILTGFSIFIFCSGAVTFINGNLSNFGNYMLLFLLLTDLPRASLLAQFALSSFSREEVRENIARGISILGPSLTLDTIVETLSIGIGALSGVKPMEELCFFAFLSVIINYVIFMTVFPACLSLALELTYHSVEGRNMWRLSSLKKVLQIESDFAPNPVIQKVKMIMTAGLMMVHILSRWPMSVSNSNFENCDNRPCILERSTLAGNKDFIIIETFLRKLFSIGPEQFKLIAFLCGLIIKYICFDRKDNLNEDLIAVVRQQHLLSEDEKRLSESFEDDNSSTPQRSSTPTASLNQQDSDTESVIAENKNKNKRSMGDKKLTSFFLGDDSSSDSSDYCELLDQEVQTDVSIISRVKARREIREARSLNTLIELLKNEGGVKDMSDEEIIILVDRKFISPYKLESVLGDAERGVRIRRLLLSKEVSCGSILNNLPYTNYDYKVVLGACCENVIGYMPIPLGIAGPLLLDGKKYQIPMATTEGCLIASTNRGCRALTLCGGVSSSVVGDEMTRGPVVRFPTAMRAANAMNWLQQEENFSLIKETFDSTSRFARLNRILPKIAGPYLYLRFSAKTGDAMGMNMLSKGTELALYKFQEIFPDMKILSLSGNFCSDKKPSAVNWIEGRGKSIVCEAFIPETVVDKVLKTNVQSLVDLNIAKNLVGSAMAGSIGGFNAHAANVVTAIYIATGQDPAQNVSSSNCMTLIEASGANNDHLHISCTMPSMELGTIGGGTILPAQASCLDLLTVRGSCLKEPGRNAQQFARIVCATVLAAELSLLSALASGHLVKSHMKHNRSTLSINAAPVAPFNSSSSSISNPNQRFLSQR